MSAYQFQSLFGTPVWSAMLDDSDALNAELLEIGRQFIPRTNYFHLPGEGVARLKREVFDKATEIGREWGWQQPVSFLKGRQNPIHPGQSDSPHHHGAAKLVGVYYVKAVPGQGDILLHDPRAGVYWQDPQARTDLGKTQRAFHRITPISGMLLLFPGYLVHSVEHNATDDVRISVAIEVYTEMPSERDYFAN